MRPVLALRLDLLGLGGLLVDDRRELTVCSKRKWHDSILLILPVGLMSETTVSPLHPWGEGVAHRSATDVVDWCTTPAHKELLSFSV